jgi:3-phenylpropionate/trans-cinnamate dioxygenase ferredoxin component
MAKQTEHEYLLVAKLSDFEGTQSLVREVEDRYVVLIRSGEQVYCIDDVCTHDGGTLSDGEIQGNCIVCPRHGAKFDYRSGKALTMPATVPTGSHDVSIRGGEVYVRLKDY